MNKEVKELIDTLKEYADGFTSVLAPTEESVKALLDYINQLETNRDEAIEEIKDLLEHWRGNDLVERDLNILLSLLERGKE